MMNRFMFVALLGLTVPAICVAEGDDGSGKWKGTLTLTEDGCGLDVASISAVHKVAINDDKVKLSDLSDGADGTKYTGAADGDAFEVNADSTDSDGCQLDKSISYSNIDREAVRGTRKVLKKKKKGKKTYITYEAQFKYVAEVSYSSAMTCNGDSVDDPEAAGDQVSDGIDDGTDDGVDDGTPGDDDDSNEANPDIDCTDVFSGKLKLKLTEQYTEVK